MRFSFAAGLFWLSVACCAIAQLLIIRSVLGARSPLSPPTITPRSRSGTEVVWAVLPALGLALLLFFTWRAIDARFGPPQVRAAHAVET